MTQKCNFHGDFLICEGIFKDRALKIWLQVGLRMVPKSYFMWPDLKRHATVPPTCKNCVTIHFLGLKCVTKTVWFANIKLDQKRHDLPHDSATFFRGNSSEPPTDANPGNSHQSVSDPGLARVRSITRAFLCLRCCPIRWRHFTLPFQLGRGHIGPRSRIGA